MAAVRCMLVLRVLRTPARAALEDLPGLVSLRDLRVGALDLPSLYSQVADFSMSYNLPTHLTRFETFRLISPWALCALKPPAPCPSGDPTCALLTGWRPIDSGEIPWCLVVERDDIIDRRLTSVGAGVLRAALRSLQAFEFRPRGSSTFDEVPKGLGIAARFREAAVAPPVGGELRSHVASWLGDVAVVRPEVLRLFGFALCPHDMYGVARSLGGLKGRGLGDVSGECMAAAYLGSMNGIVSGRSAFTPFTPVISLSPPGDVYALRP